MTLTFSINVEPLPDNDVWFVNAAAWSNYWAGMTASADINAIDTSLYVPVAFDTNLNYFALNIDGLNTHYLATQAIVESLINRVDVLNAAFETMRTELRNAGLITNAQ